MSLQRQVANLAFIVIVLIVSGAFTVYVFESARYMEMGCDAAGVVPSIAVGPSVNCQRRSGGPW